jgi:ATP-dependent RNA helicase RhlE
MTFSELNLIQPVLRAISDEGYTSPTPIQEQGIPVMLEGRDLLGVAQTGTGKTCAFAVPILHRMYESRPEGKKRGPIRALILTPTRELAVQVNDSFKTYGKYTGFKSTVIFGGVNQYHQVQSLRAYPEIVVATPGRLLDLINQGHVHLEHLEFFVLDEADRMLDMGFIHDVKRILSYVPEKRQSVFFSATMPDNVASLANSILSNPVEVAVTPVSSTSENIAQSLYFVNKNNKGKLLVHLLEERDIKSALVFTRTKHRADKIMKELNQLGIKTDAIHGNKSQSARQLALNNFKRNKVRILVATDIAARGIDVDNLEHVFNFEIPNEPENYVHRIGRTGRAGASGTAFSFCEQEEMGFLRSIHRLLPEPIEVVLDHPYAEELTLRETSGELGRNGRPGNRGGAKSGGNRGGGPRGKFGRNDRPERSDRGERGNRDNNSRREFSDSREKDSSFRPERSSESRDSRGSSDRNGAWKKDRPAGEGRRDDRREGGFNSDRREGGFNSDRREGGFNSERSGGFDREKRDNRGSGERRSFGNNTERRSESRPFGESRSNGNGFGERRSFGNDSGERRSFGNRDENRSTERRSFGNDSGERRSFGDRNDNRGGGERRDLKDKASRFDRRDKPAGNGGGRSSDKPSFDRRGPAKSKSFAKKKSW